MLISILHDNSNRTFILSVSIQKLCIFVVQMKMQLAALNDKELVSEKQGTLWNKAAIGYFEFSLLTSIITPRLRTKIRTRDRPNTKQASQSLTLEAQSYKDCI